MLKCSTVTASALEADILLRLFAENLLKQSGEVPADTAQVPMHGISAIAAAKATRLQEKETPTPDSGGREREHGRRPAA